MKLFKVLLLTLALISVTFHSRESKAAVGAIFAAPAVVTGGLVVAGGAVGLTAAAATIDLILLPRNPDTTGFLTGITALLMIPVVILGLVILEEEQEMKFGPLNAKDAAKLQISKQELQAYNHELDQLNNLAAFVDEEISRDGNATLEESVALWNEVKPAVSPEAFKALVKVNTQIFKN